MQNLGQQGWECYALSLRGQGGSDDGPSPHAAAEAAAAGGVALAVNVADIAGFLSSLPRPAVLLGHSLGGMFVQEYLAQLQMQQIRPEQQQGQQMSDQQQQQLHQQQQPASALPQLAGAALLASATAGTVMAFGDFIADVGLREFLYQMWVVARSAHLKDVEVARYCWWPDGLSDEEAGRYFKAISSSSRLQPYRPSEIARWAPDAAPAGAALPPVLALGGCNDRIIRPFQVRAAEQQWRARVVLLPGVTHDVMLGTQAGQVVDALLQWLAEEVLPRQLSGASHAAAQPIGHVPAVGAPPIAMAALRYLAE